METFPVNPKISRAKALVRFSRYFKTDPLRDSAYLCARPKTKPDFRVQCHDSVAFRLKLIISCNTPECLDLISLPACVASQFFS